MSSPLERQPGRFRQPLTSPGLMRTDGLRLGCVCLVCTLILLSSLYIVLHTHLIMDEGGLEGIQANKFVRNSHSSARALEVVIDIPLPSWWLQSHHKFSEPKHREIIHDIVDKSLQHAPPVSLSGEAVSTGAANEPVARMAPPVVIPPVAKMVPPQMASRSQADQDLLDESCPHLDEIKFWRETTEKDAKWHNPYSSKGVFKYVTFEPDVGGWNNIRMQMEIVLVFAYATGRILVLPPDQPMYLLNKGKGHEKHHNFRGEPTLMISRY